MNHFHQFLVWLSILTVPVTGNETIAAISPSEWFLSPLLCRYDDDDPSHWRDKSRISLSLLLSIDDANTSDLFNLSIFPSFQIQPIAFDVAMNLEIKKRRHSIKKEKPKWGRKVANSPCPRPFALAATLKKNVEMKDELFLIGYFCNAIAVTSSHHS